MPKIRRENTDAPERITIRLDKDAALYYRKRAKENGKSVSEFLREAIVHGMVAENVLDAEQRMQSILVEMSNLFHVAQKSTVPDSLILSTYTCESILTKIVEVRNIQELYEAQDNAKERLKKEKETAHV
jgi:uncharacterized protein (DUF1778 family)